MTQTRNLNDWYLAREQIVDFAAKELQGTNEEILSSSPLNRFIVGILNPQPSSKKTATNRGDETEVLEPQYLGSANAPDIGREDPADDGVSLSHHHHPSSIGLTFALPAKNHKVPLDIFAEATHYSFDENEKSWTPLVAGSDSPFTIMIDPRTINVEKYTTLVSNSNEKLQVLTMIRPAVDGRIRITVTLVNLYSQDDFTGKRDSYCWFRPSLRIRSQDVAFEDGAPRPIGNSNDRDIRNSDFLYRSHTNIAQGHGCSPDWEETSSSVHEIKTTFFPRQEVKLASAQTGGPGDEFGSYDLNMGAIAKKSGYFQLELLANAYEQWITAKRSALSIETGLDNEMRSIGGANLDEADLCLQRIRNGIAALQDPNIARAFELMNLAMIQQRDAQDKARGIQPQRQSNNKYDTKQRWYPFQIAFILMNIPGLSDSRHEDREIADLLWFPTGGGKTEAYLGCIAFSSLFRRIKNGADGGVSAIMRYTLRILTTDQFMRAAGLICALEVLRKEELPSSEIEISLGLWVGDATSFNSLADARKELRQLKSGAIPETESKLLQVKRCPHCGEKIDSSNYEIGKNGTAQGLTISCPRLTCPFHNGLPLYIIDEDLYDKRPTLVIGTVDKFAQMTWKAEVSKLFSFDEKYSKPDLIVQDELHLISGPLGTMVGLYESAFDLALSDKAGNRCKVIASTATIRRADKQVRAVFDRKANQFPPAGLDPSDNYFSKSADRSVAGTREYVGVIAPGTSHSTLLVRLYAALLQAGKTLDAPDHIRDTYWTLLGYFNSLRVLGSAYLQVVDDIPARIQVISERLNLEPRTSKTFEPYELTSRVSAAQILSIRDKMDVVYPDSPEVVLATNMISVGLDIDRLGLMVVAGQPQNTSEYIQATSRVGRKHPGLVFVAFNAQRSRDVSHFESFISFHRSLYRSVEATTATPFAARARDRGAHGVLVAAARMLFSELRNDNDAGLVSEFEDEIRDNIIALIVERAKRLDFEENSSLPNAEPLKNQLEELLAEWIDEADNGGTNRYGSMGKFGNSKSADGSNSLLIAAGNTTSGDSTHSGPPWETLTSLRDVDSETSLQIIDFKKKGK